MDLEALSDFVLAARHGGYGAASRASARSKASIARRVADLERRLGVRLFERGHAGLRLTDAGSELFGRIAGPFREIEEASEAVGPENTLLKGRLRISAAVVFAHAHLVRIAAGFARLHPGVEIEIVADDGIIDLVEDRFDIVIRANPSPSDQLVGKCITRTDRVAVAAPGLPMPSGRRKGTSCLPQRRASRRLVASHDRGWPTRPSAQARDEAVDIADGPPGGPSWCGCRAAAAHPGRRRPCHGKSGLLGDRGRSHH